MTEAFTFDTSGTVHFATPYAKKHGLKTFYRWDDFKPFDQGYMEGLFASSPILRADDPADNRDAGFRDLSPEALAMILGDTDAVLMLAAHAHLRDSTVAGREFWERRQAGRYDPRIAAPLTVSLTADGKIRLHAT
jgi:hypothetical protein